MSQAPVIASQPPAAASQSAPALLSQHKNGGTSATTTASLHGCGTCGSAGALKTSLVETTRPPPSVDPRNAGLSALTLSIHPKFPVRHGKKIRRAPCLSQSLLARCLPLPAVVTPPLLHPRPTRRAPT